MVLRWNIELFAHPSILIIITNRKQLAVHMQYSSICLNKIEFILPVGYNNTQSFLPTLQDSFTVKISNSWRQTVGLKACIPAECRSIEKLLLMWCNLFSWDCKSEISLAPSSRHLRRTHPDPQLPVTGSAPEVWAAGSSWTRPALSGVFLLLLLSL